MKDYSTPEGLKLLWDLSTRLLEEFSKIAKPVDLHSDGALAVLVIMLGRYTGALGYRSVDVDEMWKHLTHEQSKVFFKMGFIGERAEEN